MTKFIKKDTEDLRIHMLACKKKNSIIFAISSSLMDTAQILSNYVVSIMLFFILLIGIFNNLYQHI